MQTFYQQTVPSSFSARLGRVWGQVLFRVSFVCFFFTVIPRLVEARFDRSRRPDFPRILVDRLIRSVYEIKYNALWFVTAVRYGSFQERRPSVG